MQMARENKPAAERRGGHRFQHHCAGPIAEEDAGAAILPVENARECLRSDDE